MSAMNDPTDDTRRRGLEQRGMLITALGGLCLAVSGIGCSLWLESDAILLVGMLGTADALIGLTALRVAPGLESRDDGDLSFGHAALGPLLQFARGLLVTMLVVWALVAASQAALLGGTLVSMSRVVGYALVAGAGCLGFGISMFGLARRSDSLILGGAARQWLLLAGILGVIVVTFGLVRLFQPPEADLVRHADQLAVVLMVVVLLPTLFDILRGSRWPIIGRAPAQALRETVERVLADVMSEVPVSGHTLRVGRLGRLAYVQFYGVLDDASDLDAERQDVVRARLYERLRPLYRDLALDVAFTRDPVWSERSVRGLDRFGASVTVRRL